MQQSLSRRQLLAGAAGGTTALTAGCQSVFGDSETEDEFFTVALARDPTEEKWDAYSGITPYYTHVFEPLVDVTEEMGTAPLLATEWEATDETTWEFSLREDVTFHNGDSLTATAVVRSFDRVFEQFSWVPGWIGVEPDGVTAVEETTVRFETTEPFPAFPGTISHNYFGVQHPGATETPVGTGPFEVDNVNEEQSITLTPYENYRDGTATPSELTFEWVKDPNTRVLSLQNESVDVAQRVPKSQAATVDDASGTAIETNLTPEAGLAAVNLYESPTDDERLRKALNWAVDQEEIVENVLGGIGQPARGPLSSIIPWAIHDDLPTYGPDRDRARELVEESGYGGETLSILVNSENTDDATIAQVFSGWFEEIGVASEIRQVDPASFYDTFTSGEANLTLVSFGSNSAACDYLVRAMFHSEGSDNRKLYEQNGTGVYNPGDEVDRLIKQGYRAETTAAKRDHYGDVQRRVVDTGAVIPLYYNESVFGRQADITGIDWHPVDNMTEWSDIDVCLLPVGSTEQHGPHLPLGTDVFVAQAIAAATARRAEVLSLPPVQAGIAPYHGRFDGTIDIPYEVFRDYAYHVLAATEAWGVETVVAVNGHGGNRAALKDACRRLTRDTGLDAHYWAWTDAVDEAVTHAGSAETSVLRYLVPELVGTPQTGAVESWGEWIHGAQVAKFTDEFTENGVVGDPTSATAEEGQRLFEMAVGELEALLEWLQETDRQDTESKPNDSNSDGGQR